MIRTLKTATKKGSAAPIPSPHYEDFAEAVAWRCSVKKMFSEISQNS